MLILKYAEGYDYEELAAIFELSVSACKMRVSRAREKLQQRYPEPQTASLAHAMSNDFLDQLAALEAPEPPPEFDRKLHQRVNRALLIQQLLGLAVGVPPWAVLHFFRAPAGGGDFSLTGRFTIRTAGRKNDDSPVTRAAASGNRTNGDPMERPQTNTSSSLFRKGEQNMLMADVTATRRRLRRTPLIDELHAGL